MRTSSRKSTKAKQLISSGQHSNQVSFSSETLLQQAIAGLLARQPEITGVQILQGTQELGKDVIFYIKGGFGEPVLCACVIKNTRITGDVTKPSSARTILFQAQQAFDSVHVDTLGKEVRVERVYVITPFDLPPTTITSIKGSLNEHAGQVVFIGGSTLFDLFKKYWPDYLADEAAILEQHLKHTKTQLVDESPLPALAFQYALGSVPQKLTKVYVTQNFHREINSFRYGDIFSSLPKPQIVTGRIPKSGIIGIQGAFLNFDDALAYLNEWGLCPAAYNPEKLQLSLKEFIGQLTSAWETQLDSERKHRAASKANDEELDDAFEEASDRVTAVAITNSKTFEKSLWELVGQRQQLLSLVNEKLRELEEFVSSEKLSPLKSLSDQRFFEACFLNDCVRAAPEGLFVNTYKSVRIEYPKDILSKWNKSLFIVGAPGYGKTSFCRWRAMQDAARFNAEKSNVVPIYVPLHKLASTSLTSFEETFLKGLGHSALIGDIGLLSQRNVRIYLDGLDEVGSPDQRKAVVDLAGKGVEEYTNVQVVLTSRDYIYGTWLNWLPKINLSPFDDSQIKEFIDRWFGRGTDINLRFCQQLASLPTIHNLMTTPLLATLIVMVFRQTSRLPESKTRLYDMFIGLLSGGWDMVKGVLRGSLFGPEVKVLVLSSLAATLHENRRREFNDDDMMDAIHAVLPRERDWRRLHRELIMDGIISLSGGILQFSHLSYQEFLTAKAYMGSPYSDRASKALALYLCGDNWWRDVLKFYVGLSSGLGDICDWLSRTIMQLKNRTSEEISINNAHELLAGVAESFPGYSIEEIARRVRGPLDYSSALSFLKRARKDVKLSSEDD